MDNLDTDNQPLHIAAPAVAYDLFLSHQCTVPMEGRGEAWAGGWSLGLPPGIAQHHWPLSKSRGHPLRHTFTLHIPPAYRTQGQRYVALSLFVDDQDFEMPCSDIIESFFAGGLPTQCPSDPVLAALFHHWRAPHHRSFEMFDIIETQYVAIWLTQAEFDGPLCGPPMLGDSPLLGPAPGWLDKSYGEHFLYIQMGNPGMPVFPWMAGAGRAAGLETAFAIHSRLREGDPNVGKKPREWLEDAGSDYIPAFSGEQSDALGLPELADRNHLGGTMYPVQGYPPFGPLFLECEEGFGAFNFGGGNLQLDLEKMALDWACT